MFYFWNIVHFLIGIVLLLLADMFDPCHIVLWKISRRIKEGGVCLEVSNLGMLNVAM